MGAVAYTSGSGSFNVPSVVQRIWVSAIGAGANGFSTPTGNGGGGGGWGYGAASIFSTSISYSVGFPSSCAGITGFNGSGASGGGFSAPNGGNGGTGVAGTNSAGGAAGGVSGSGSGASFAANSGSIFGGGGGYVSYTGGGGNGNNGFGGTTSGGNASGNVAGNGASYGGGGGGARLGVFNTVIATNGSGGSGFLYVSWIDMSAGSTTLRSGQTTTVSWSSPVTSGSQNVSYINNGTSNITQSFTVTDNRNSQSTITFTILPAVRINSFTVNPNPQTSGSDGIPNYNTTLSWTTTGATSVSISNIGAVSANGSTAVTDLPQSVAGVTSPATRTYTLTASDGFNTATASITVSVFNDNTPNDYSIPNQNNLEPDTFYVIDLGAITGIDMVTNVIGGPGVTVSKNNLQNYVSSITIVNNDSVQLRFRSDPFNQDPSGLPSASKSLYVDIGTVKRFFSVFTRAPDVNETFNLPDETGYVPYPDIDTVSEPSLPYLTSDTLTIDDIELQNPSGVEFKTSNPNTQVRIKRQGATTFSDWIDVRSI
jgi:hypothetical protein